MSDRRVHDWLLEESEPAVRYLTLTRLLGRGGSDPEVRDARASIATSGFVAEILARRDPAGWWVRDGPPMHPMYTATNWNMLALSDLGVTRAIPEVEASCDYWMSKSPLKGGGVGGLITGNGHHCYTGNMTRALLRFGYGDDPRVRKALDYLVRTAHPKGGWTCRGASGKPAPGRTLDAWEGLSAFAAYPRAKWTGAMEDCVARGAEFFLDRELHRQGDRYEPWYRFHWPNHYRYDLLVGLDVLTSLGYGNDPRLGFALDHLRKKRRPDGRWNLDAHEPDYDAEALRWLAAHPKEKRPTPLVFERPGSPSKMVTLKALTVLSRVG